MFNPNAVKSILLLLLAGLGPVLSAQTRDPLKWPFDKYSIWNVPIHNNATYTWAGVGDSPNFAVDEDVIILKPGATTLNVETNYADWSGNDRCPDQGPTLFSAPIPSSWIYDKTVWEGNTPNSGAAILRTDGKIVQTQPFAKCNTGFATSHYVWSADACVLTGECIAGAHGGSGLSTIGGTIRVGEFSAGAIKHAVKINLYGRENFYRDGSGGYRWPATKEDGGYNDPNAPNYYGGTNPQMKIGALLALHKNVNLSALSGNGLGLETEAGLILARALQNYGGYTVDNTAWDSYAFVVENGPDGRVRDEFKNRYGFDMGVYGSLDNSAWGRDLKRIFTNLYVISNNASGNIGGGPTTDANRRAPFACDLGTQGSGSMCGTTTTPPVSSGPKAGEVIWLKAEANGKYVSADIGISTSGPLYANKTGVGTWEKFVVSDAGSGNVYLKALANNKFVQSNQSDGGRLYAAGSAGSTWESIRFEVLSNGKLALKFNINGRYASADNYGNSQLIANRTTAQGWEQFTWGTTTAARTVNPAEDQASEAGVRVFPVPARDRFTLLVPAASAQPATITVSDLLARPVREKKVQLVRGDNYVEMDATGLRGGLFGVTILTPGRKRTGKVLIVK